VELFFLFGFSFVLGLVAATLLASSRRRVVLLLALGVALAVAYFALAWLTAPASSEEADYSCSDCSQWLGRWWEGLLMLFIIGWNLVGWCLGVLAGAGLHRLVRSTRQPHPS
jgi:hypothetical protein